MTETRPLSDALSQDRVAIVSSRYASRESGIARWQLVATIFGWIAVGALIAQAAALLVALLAFSFLTVILFAMSVVVTPLVVIPSVVVYLVASRQAFAQLRALDGDILAAYGIQATRDGRSTTYTLAIPTSRVSDDLHRTRAVLAQLEATDATA